jgi:hypothetical protein
MRPFELLELLQVAVRVRLDTPDGIAQSVRRRLRGAAMAAWLARPRPAPRSGAGGRFRQHPWTPSVAWTGHDGTHAG